MKKTLLGALTAGLMVHAYAQGFIDLSNIGNASTDPTATRNGLLFLTPEMLLNQDFNANFYAGTDSASLSLLKSFVGPTAVGDSLPGPGLFYDPTGIPPQVPGATNTAFFRIEIWLGSETTYAAASVRASSPIFSNPVAGPPYAPATFTEMPAIVLIPEPGSLALAGLGVVAVLRRCSKRSRTAARKEKGSYR